MNNPFAAIASELGRTVAETKPSLLKLNNADTSLRPAPNKWSRKEILGHLIDSASNNHQRFVRAALEGKLNFPGYDQDPLVELQQFREMDWSFLVEFWAAYNRFLAHVISVIPADAVRITCVVAKNAPVTLEAMALDYVAHLKHHLSQILTRGKAA